MMTIHATGRKREPTVLETVLEKSEKVSSVKKVFSTISKTLKITNYYAPYTKEATHEFYPVIRNSLGGLEAIRFFSNFGWWFQFIRNPNIRKKTPPLQLLSRSLFMGSGSLRFVDWLESLGTPIGLANRTALIGQKIISTAGFSSSVLRITVLLLNIAHDLLSVRESYMKLQQEQLSQGVRCYYEIKQKKAVLSLISNIVGLTLGIAGMVLLFSSVGTPFIMGFQVVSLTIGLINIGYDLKVPTPKILEVL